MEAKILLGPPQGRISEYRLSARRFKVKFSFLFYWLSGRGLKFYFIYLFYSGPALLEDNSLLDDCTCRVRTRWSVDMSARYPTIDSEMDGINGRRCRARQSSFLER